jgi:hypothetical protein
MWSIFFYHTTNPYIPIYISKWHLISLISWCTCVLSFMTMRKKTHIPKLLWKFDQIYWNFSFFFLTVCPWGNYDNMLRGNLDSGCEDDIKNNCNKYCTNPSQSDIAKGRNCCKACVDLCGKAPSRDENFKDKFEGVYKRQFTRRMNLLKKFIRDLDFVP